MAAKDLIPLKGKGDPYSDGVRAKIKGSSSEKRKRAQRVSSIKLMKPETIEKRCLELATNPQTTALEIMKMIIALKEKGGLKPQTEIQLIRSLSDAYRTVFGNKVELSGQLKFEDALVKWREERHCILASATILIDKAKAGKSAEWEKKFGREQMLQMIGCIEEFLNESNINKDYKKRIATREYYGKVARGETEDGD